MKLRNLSESDKQHISKWRETLKEAWLCFDMNSLFVPEMKTQQVRFVADMIKHLNITLICEIV